MLTEPSLWALLSGSPQLLPKVVLGDPKPEKLSPKRGARHSSKRSKHSGVGVQRFADTANWPVCAMLLFLLQVVRSLVAYYMVALGFNSHSSTWKRLNLRRYDGLGLVATRHSL